MKIFYKIFKDSIPSLILGFIVGPLSVAPIIFGDHRISKKLLSENLVLFTPYFFSFLVLMLWGIYFILFLIYPKIDNSFFARIMTNLSRYSVEYISLTLGVQICLFAVLILHFGDKGSLTQIEKDIGDPRGIFCNIVMYFLMCFMNYIIYYWGFQPFVRYSEETYIRNSRNNSWSQLLNKPSHRLGFFFIGFSLVGGSVLAIIYGILKIYKLN
jgi:hypothetical protein